MNLESYLIDWLGTKTGKGVYAEVPEGHPASFYTVERTGSQTRNRITTATIAIQSWHSGSMYDAAAMNEALKTAMDSLTAETEISACRLSSDYNFTDTTSKYYRYQAVYNITAY